MQSSATTSPESRGPAQGSSRNRLKAVLLAGVSLAVVTLATVEDAAAQAVAPGFNQTPIGRNDDGSSGPVVLPFNANFFGATYSQLYVNNNGNVTFNQSLGQFTPVGLDVDYRGPPIIAPFFADIDTRNAASGITAYGTGTYAGRTAFGVTWPAVGYFSSQANRLNTFQVVLTDRSDTGAGNFDIYYNYNRIQFETGSASGGIDGLGGFSASVGYSAGTGVDGTYYQLPGSLVPGSFLDGGPNALSTSSNGEVPGQFLFPVRNGRVMFAQVCTAGDNASTTTVANCGPNGTYTNGIFYLPTGSLALNVLRNTTITAAATGDAVLVMSAPRDGDGSLSGNVAVSVDATARIISSGGSGIQVDTRNGVGSATVTTAGTIEAASVGVLVRSRTGAVTVDNSGTVTAPVGLAGGSNSGTVGLTNSGRIQGATVGIAAGSGSGVAVTNAAAGQITFGQFGIAAASLFGPLTITNAGSLNQNATLPSQVSAALLAILPDAYRQLNATGTAGIYARTFGANLAIANAGTITATTTGIDAAIDGSALGAAAPTGGTLSIFNAGTITAAVAIDTSRTVATAEIFNSGTINGALALNAVSRFANERTGTFNAVGSSTFGGGALTNAGIVAMGADATLSGLSSFVNDGGLVRASGRSSSIGSTSFINAGMIDLQNGRTGDTLTINGNYVGRDGRVNLDVSTQAGLADRLVINGNASGTTGLNLVNVTPGAAFTSSPVLIQVNGQQSAGAFTLASAQNFGALDVVLANNQLPTANTLGNTVSLVTLPSAVGQSGPTAVIAAQTIAFQGSTAILDRVTQLRGEAQRGGGGQAGSQALQYASTTQYAALVSKDPIAPNLVAVTPAPASNVKPAVWARAFGDIERRTGFSSLSFAGGNSVRDLGYNQTTGGLLAGADVVISGITAPDDGVILGVMGGYTTANVRLNQAAGRQDYDGGTVGAYATYLKGGFFADALFKTDLLGLDITAPGIRQSTGLQNYNVLGNIGYRFDLPHALYIEPTAGLEYVATVFDRTPVLAANAVPLQDGDAFRGRIGARLGTEFIQDNIRVEPSVTGLIYDVFTESGTTATFGGGTRITGLTNVGKVRGEVQASINFLNLSTGLSGFLRADYRVGGDLVGGGGRAGIRYQW